MPTITIPHQYKPRDYQLEFLKSKARFKIAVWHRRGGKSKTVLNEQVRKALSSKGIYYYFLPTYKQAKQVVWDSLVGEHIPHEVIDRKNESELAIYYKNGSIQRFVGCEDVDKHRGINPRDVVFDEYSEMSEEIWTAVVQPVLRENKGTATFIFTPKGKNHAWKLLEMARDNPDWFVSVKGINDTGAMEPSEIEKAKKETPEALFRQEYLCSFEDGAGQFFRGVRECLFEAPKTVYSEAKYQIGVDLAKYHDWTVITPFNASSFEVGEQDRFNQVDWNLQKARIASACVKYNKALINPDATGVGDPIVEDLRSMGLPIRDEGFKFTEESRKKLLYHLALLIEQRKIKIPRDEGLISELESFRFQLGDGGKVKVCAPEGMHDDRVMSLALAVWGYSEPVQDDYASGSYDFAAPEY